MNGHFADKLLAAIEAKGSPVCVGIDPVFEKLPPGMQAEVDSELEQVVPLGNFCHQVLEVIAPIVPAVKIQSAYFERYGATGVELYDALTLRAQELGLLVISDVKRNDIGSTASAYAAGHLRRAHSPDAITVNGYLGADGLEPFVEAAVEKGKGIFVLVRTSNPSAKVIQDFSDASGRTFYQHMADQVAAIGAGCVGECGYSCVGAVVGATWPDEARALRKLMPQQLFLVPGYGAQGGTAADAAASFKSDGTGAIVNASRSVIFAFANEKYAGMSWPEAVEAAAKAFAADIRGAL